MPSTTASSRAGRSSSPATRASRCRTRVPVEPTLTTEEANAAVAVANRIAADLRIARGTRTWTISAATIRGWISFGQAADGSYQPVIDTTKIDKALGPVATGVARAAHDA